MNNNKDKQLDLDFFNVDNQEKEADTQDVKKEKDAVDKEKKTNIIVTDRGEEFTKEEWNRPIFENGPTRQEVEEWKDKHGNIYFTPFEGKSFIWRTLTRPEYREIASNQEWTLMDKEEAYTDKCMLFPRNYSSSKVSQGEAGIPSLLTEMIMEKSGFIAQSAPIKL